MFRNTGEYYKFIYKYVIIFVGVAKLGSPKRQLRKLPRCPGYIIVSVVCSIAKAKGESWQGQQLEPFMHDNMHVMTQAIDPKQKNMRKIWKYHKISEIRRPSLVEGHQAAKRSFQVTLYCHSFHCQQFQVILVLSEFRRSDVSQLVLLVRAQEVGFNPQRTVLGRALKS